MELICAVDLLDGGAVRLAQGDYDRRVARVDDPVELARSFVEAGCRRVHVVDLAGARDGRPRQLDLVRAIAEGVRGVAADAVVEAGGGLRRPADVDALLEAEVEQAILGTAAIDQPGFLGACAGRHPGRIIASLDLRRDLVALDGWLRSADGDPIAVARRLLDEGAARLILTDADRDGTLAGPNLELLGRYREALPGARLVAAGGISSIDDLVVLAAAGIDGAVVGLALLAGGIDVAEALVALTPRSETRA